MGPDFIERLGIRSALKYLHRKSQGAEGNKMVSEPPARKIAWIEKSIPRGTRKLKEVIGIFKEMIAIVDKMQHSARRSTDSLQFAECCLEFLDVLEDR